MSHKEIEGCRLCGGQTEEVLSLGQLALTGIFPRPPQKVLTGPLTVHMCFGECGLVQLGQTYDLNLMYGPTYGYRSGLNQSMVTHLHTLADKLCKVAYPAKHDVILDIGSSDGTLLASMPGRFTRIGIDPSAEKFRHHYPDDIELVVGFFPTNDLEAILGDRKVKIVTTVAMFYDLESPLTFAQEVARILADDGIWHTEQSYLPRMLAQNAYDTICHEHLEYYSLAQVQWIADHAGLKIIGLEFNAINGGSFGVTMALKDSSYEEATNLKQMLRAERSLGLNQPFTYRNFKAAIDIEKDMLLTLLEGLPTRPVGYGASTKGNALLQYCGLTKNEIPYIYDINPDKDGCVTPGTDIPISMAPTDGDRYLVLPWHFKQAIFAKETEFLKRGGKLIFPLPKVEVYGAK